MGEAVGAGQAAEQLDEVEALPPTAAEADGRPRLAVHVEERLHQLDLRPEVLHVLGDRRLALARVVGQQLGVETDDGQRRAKVVEDLLQAVARAGRGLGLGLFPPRPIQGGRSVHRLGGLVRVATAGGRPQLHGPEQCRWPQQSQGDGQPARRAVGHPGRGGQPAESDQRRHGQEASGGGAEEPVGQRDVHQQERVQLAAEAAGEAEGDEHEAEPDREIERAGEGAERRADPAGREEGAPEQGGRGQRREPGVGAGGAPDGEGQQDPEEEQGGR